VVRAAILFGCGSAALGRCRRPACRHGAQICSRRSW